MATFKYNNITLKLQIYKNTEDINSKSSYYFWVYYIWIHEKIVLC